MAENFEAKEERIEEEAEETVSSEEAMGEADAEEDGSAEEVIIDEDAEADEGLAGEAESEEGTDDTEPDEDTDETSEEESDEDASGKSAGKKASGKAAKAAKAYGFFKKDKKDGQIADLQDRVKRQMAEFENFRKRSEKEKSQMYDMGARSMLEKILPVVDNFERGLDGLPEGEENPFADGMKMVYKQLMTALTDAGVKEIEAVGKEFDPELHNAVMHIDDDQYGENEIVEVLQKGYTYHDGVVRHSMVKVAN